MKALMKSDQTKHATPMRKMPKIRPATKNISPIIGYEEMSLLVSGSCPQPLIKQIARTKEHELNRIVSSNIVRASRFVFFFSGTSKSC